MTVIAAVSTIAAAVLAVLYRWALRDTNAVAELVHAILADDAIHAEAKKDYRTTIQQLPCFDARQLETDARGFVFAYATRFSQVRHIGAFARSRMKFR